MNQKAFLEGLTKRSHEIGVPVEWLLKVAEGPQLNSPAAVANSVPAPATPPAPNPVAPAQAVPSPTDAPLPPAIKQRATARLLGAEGMSDSDVSSFNAQHARNMGGAPVSGHFNKSIPTVSGNMRPTPGLTGQALAKSIPDQQQVSPDQSFSSQVENQPSGEIPMPPTSQEQQPAPASMRANARPGDYNRAGLYTGWNDLQDGTIPKVNLSHPDGSRAAPMPPSQGEYSQGTNQALAELAAHRRRVISPDPSQNIPGIQQAYSGIQNNLIGMDKLQKDWDTQQARGGWKANYPGRFTASGQEIPLPPPRQSVHSARDWALLNRAERLGGTGSNISSQRMY